MDRLAQDLRPGPEIEMEARPLLNSDSRNLRAGANETGVNGPEEEYDLPPPAEGKQQLRAMLKRQWLFKKRGWFQTAVELISPLLMMFLLVMAYHLSDVEHYDAHIFANQTLPFMERVVQASNNPQAFVEHCPSLKYYNGLATPDQLALALASLNYRLADLGVTSETIANLTGKWKSIPAQLNNPRLNPDFSRFNPDFPRINSNFSQNNPDLASTIPDFSQFNPSQLSPNLSHINSGFLPSDLNITSEQASEAVAEALNDAGIVGGFGTPNLAVDLMRCLGVAREASRIMHYYYQYHGPLPVPSFDAFVMAHKMLKQVLVADGNYDRILELQERFGNVLGNLLTLGRICFAPNTTQVQRLVRHLSRAHQFFDEFYVGTYPSESSAVKAAMGPYGNEMWAVVVLENLDFQELNFDFTLRMNYTTLPRTYKILHKWTHSVHNNYKRYITSGFFSIQEAINTYLLGEIKRSKIGIKSDFLGGQKWGVPFPVGGYVKNPFYDAVGPLLGLVMCLCTLYPLAMLVKSLVEEKETRSKETMRIMGLKLWVFDLSWVITYLVVFATISLSVTLVMSATFFPRSSFSLMFTMFLLFTVSLIPFGFFISVFFSKSKLAAIVAPFAHFAAIMPRYIFFRSADDQAISGKTAACLLPPTAFTFGVDLLGQYEGAFMGLNWSEIMEDEFPLAILLGMLLADIFIYALLAWYLEQVLPSEYGSPQPFWFPFSKAYWLGDSYRVHSVPSLKPIAHNSLEVVEPVEENGMKRAVNIRQLQKVYAGGKTAVNGLDLDIYEGQITALLGHNGAGKSTTISMLTGLIRPSGGSAEIWGRSIRTDMGAARRVIGVCPQHNVLFSKLTVREHLELFAALKGVSLTEQYFAAVEMVQALNLEGKMDTPAMALSGGMKRKLQVALALIGGSKVVFLDEPTSGMDPHSRRGMWELLRKFKNNRAIVLTTHYMDEADILCDRIAIMSEGRLRCCGSSLYLKAKYGVGYNLTMTKATSDCNSSDIANLVKCHVSTAVPLSSAGGEIAFQLPLAGKSSFAALFRDLENRKNELKIGGYGVSMTTLEEVFLRLAQEGDAPVRKPQILPVEREHQNGQENGVKDSQNGDTNSAPVIEVEQDADNLETVSTSNTPQENKEQHKGYHRIVSREEGVDVEGGQTGTLRRQSSGRAENRSFGRAFTQLMKKRALIARRDIKGLANMALLPVAVIAFVLLILRITIDPAGPSLALNLDIFTKLSKSHPKKTVIPITYTPEKENLQYFGSGGVVLKERGGVKTSMDMSWELLNTLDSEPARYGALVFNDVIWQHSNFTNLVNFDPASLLASPSPILTKSFNQTQNVPLLNSLFKRLNISSPFTGPPPTTQKWVKTESGLGLPVSLMLMHNTSSDHALAALMGEVYQAQMRMAANRSSAQLVTRSHPLPLTQHESMKIQTFLTVLAALFVLIPFCYLAATFAVFVVKETATKAKHLQLVSGANVLAYWLSTYAWDMIVYIFIAAITMVVFALYRDQAFVGSGIKVLGVFTLLVFFGAAVIPLSYVYSFGFSNFASAQVGIAGLHFITGFVMVVASFVMAEIDKTKALNRVLVWGYRCFPPFNFGEGLIALSALDYRVELGGKTISPFEWKTLGRPLLFMFLESIFFLALTLAIDRDLHIQIFQFLSKSVLKMLKTKTSAIFGIAVPAGRAPEDADVARERKRVEEGLAEDDAVLVVNLGKVYPGGKLAVSDLCLGIPPSECFGFLGVNGAGKTTTLSILTGDLRPTTGEAFVNGYSILTELPAVQRQIGYCPQFDPLLDLLTGREQLEMYARLKGVAERRVATTVEETIQAVGLQKYADRICGNYSGGNKRKLSLAIALVGNPAAIFLDEPSSGMDPVARRAMWDIIQTVTSTTGACVILTTHSMEECEALCGRVGVMVAGKLVCLGSIQHLKSRFGQGYHLEIKTASPQTSELQRFVTESFAGAILEEEHSGRLKYRLPIAGLSLSKVFGTIEAASAELRIEDYSVSQATLEQIFLSFAKKEQDRVRASDD